MNKQLLFKTIIGSQAYGTAVEGSDIDMKGVYAQHPDDLMAFGYKEQYHESKDEEYFEVRRFLQLAQSANPTIIELLWMPEECVQHIHPAFQHIIDNRDMFLTKQCRNSFAGYAIQQIKKARGLDKKMNWEKEKFEKKGPSSFCYIYSNGRSIALHDYLEAHGLNPDKCGIAKVPHITDGYNLYYSDQGEYKGLETTNFALKLSNIPKGRQPLAFMFYNQNAFEHHTKDYKSYKTWLKERNEQRYVDAKNHGQKIDGKNMLHCIRLIDEAKEIAETGTINIKRPNAEYLISIRKGEVDLETILSEAEAGVSQMDELFKNSNLPNKTNPDDVDTLLREVRRRIDWT